LVSVVRRSAPRSRHEQSLDEGADLPAAEHSDPLLRLQAQEDADHLLHRLQQRLTPLEYRVLLTRLQDCSYQEAAARLGVSKKTVDNAVQRIRKKVNKSKSFSWCAETV
jgi:RNA polymerase sporulation-specific sigma factor